MASSTTSSEAYLDKRYDDFLGSPSGIGKIYYDIHVDEGSESPVDSEKNDSKPSKPSSDPSQFPDGGLQAWLVVLGGFFALVCSFGWINCIGVFQDYYEAHQLRDYDPSTVAWISSLETFMMFAGGPFIGKLFDNYGPRYILLVGTFLHVFGLMMISLSTEYYQFILAQGVCSAIGSGFIFYPSVTVIGTWFFKNRAFAIGVVAAGSSFGGIIFPIMVERLIPQIGFPWTMRTIGFTVLALMVLVNLTVKSRLPPKPTPFNVKEFFYPLAEPVYAANIFACFLFFICIFIPINFVVVQAKEEGMSAMLAGYLVPILNAGSVFGRVMPGWIADRVGRFNMMIFMSYFTTLFVLALWLPSKSNASIIAFAAIYGFGSGAFVSLAPALIAQITKDISKLGVRTGTLFAAIAIAALIGNPVAGALVTMWDGQFTGLQIFTGVMMFGGSCFFVVARVLAGGWSLKAKI